MTAVVSGVRREQAPSFLPAHHGALILERNEVHVWRLLLEQPSEILAELSRTMAAEERQRAERYYFARDRERFVAARGFVRILLSRYLCLPPQEITFTCGRHGKPSLAGEPQTGLRFNLSHSGALGLLAVARGREAGIDLEQQRPVDDLLLFAERNFAAREYADLRALPASAQTEAFFAYWTRKEAYLKACGAGLALSPDQVEVTPLGEPARLLRIGGDGEEARCWSLLDLQVAPGYAAALVIERNVWGRPPGSAAPVTSFGGEVWR